MFAALRARLEQLAEAPRRAREMAAERLTADMPKGHATPTADGIMVSTANRRASVGAKWQAMIAEAIRDATRGGG